MRIHYSVKHWFNIACILVLLPFSNLALSNYTKLDPAAALSLIDENGHAEIPNTYTSIGANAFASFIKQEDIEVKAVLNNDVIGGIICGQTSSPPSCPGTDNIDSTQVRLFSNGGYSSKHKCLVRFASYPRPSGHILI